jgi:hypothetical protein
VAVAEFHDARVNADIKTMVSTQVQQSGEQITGRRTEAMNTLYLGIEPKVHWKGKTNSLAAMLETGGRRLVSPKTKWTNGIKTTQPQPAIESLDHLFHRPVFVHASLRFPALIECQSSRH